MRQNLHRGRLTRCDLVQCDLAKAFNKGSFCISHRSHHNGIDVLLHQTVRMAAAIAYGEKVGAAEGLIDS